MRLVDNLVLEAQEHNHRLRALALINQASTNHLSQEADQTRELILARCSGMRVASTVVGSRVAFQRASSVGQTVAEFARPTAAGSGRCQTSMRRCSGICTDSLDWSASPDWC